MRRPVACTLEGSDRVERGEAWHELLASGLVRRETVPGGIRLTADPGAAQRLIELVELERECCAWIDYEIGARTVTMTAEGDGESVLAGMFR